MRPWEGKVEVLSKSKIAIPLSESSLDSREKGRRSSPCDWSARSEGPAINDQRMGCPLGSCSGPDLRNLVAKQILQGPGQKSQPYKPSPTTLSSSLTTP
ncbi:hypothetical protein AVEN_80022-1 [Araneus ventricosus]|uniref:Uncharacterized protein n=1 Tax=Araneus ventricosus TaxID=182803 RepID=A0A4Y2FQ99_ARAVE|nr:hypothetical protein AVEN_80022-1 [Araneus ventricosus]